MFEKRDFKDPRYIAWRDKIYKRDHYKCQMPGCTYTDKKLNAHHIKRWADFAQLRFLPSNGICLCYTHHKRVTGFEEDFEELFMGIVNKVNSDLKMSILMQKYEKNE